MQKQKQLSNFFYKLDDKPVNKKSKKEEREEKEKIEKEQNEIDWFTKNIDKIDI